LGEIPACSYRIADVPRDPATIRKMNLLRSLGVGGIRSSADNLPRTAVPVCFDSSNGDLGTIIKGASRPQMADIQPLVAPLKYVKEDEPPVTASSPEASPEALKLLRRLSLSGSTCSMSASSISSTPTSQDGTSTPPRSTKQNHRKKKRSINFSPTVSVIQIPMRTEYSSRIATRLWSSRTEIRDNANRNVIEFSAENWDWRNAIEDDGMFVCTASGELIHPVHCQDFYKKITPAAASGGAVPQIPI